jgi:hypothetical protein
MRSGRQRKLPRLWAWSDSPGRFSCAASNAHKDPIAHAAPNACPHKAALSGIAIEIGIEKIERNSLIREKFIRCVANNNLDKKNRIQIASLNHLFESKMAYFNNKQVDIGD